MTNPDVYPITYAFEQEMAPKVEEAEEGLFRAAAQSLFEVMAGNLGEYEHGSADIIDVYESRWPQRQQRVLLESYAEVCKDILLTFISVHS